MKKSKVLWHILRMTNTDKILISFVSFLFLCALGIWLVEPGVTSYVDALWYCFVSVTTIGFGDILVTTFAGKAITVVLTIYGIIVIALIPGVVVAFYNESIAMKRNDTLLQFLDKLEHLPELSHEELTEISKKVKQQRYKL